MSARSAVALQRGVDEDLLAKVDDYEHSDLDQSQKASLRLADAYLGSPADITAETRAEIAAHLTPTQVVETTLKVMGFASDKVMVALGLDMEEIRLFEM
jgi:hypothetical protein